MIRTTNSSIISWNQVIPWQQLPKTFQDAIRITRELGIQYLWIDALCIIQNDVQDWEIESANMANIYSNSYLTIAATAASDSHAGLFLDRWTRVEAEAHDTGAGTNVQNAIKIPIKAHKLSVTDQADDDIFVRPRLHLAHGRFRNMENAKFHSEDAPLLTRAWAFQERLLPPRTLHFHAEELIWECKSAVQCECGELEERYNYDKFGMQGWLKNFVTGELHDNHSAARLGRVWLDLVSEFAALNLTLESDRLPALSGLAYEFSGKNLGAYIAGIWEHDLARGLLFETTETQSKDDIAVNYSPLSAPSWSWASAYLAGQNRISYSRVLRFGFIQDSSFSVLGVYLTPNRSNPFSWVEHGLLLLKGACTIATITTEISVPGGPQDRKMVLEVGGVKDSISLDHFISDGCIQNLDNTPLLCILVGRPWHSRIEGVELEAWEYVLVLQEISSDINRYKRTGLLLTGNGHWSLSSEPVRTVLIA
jgi:hypothetical protein